MFMYYSERTAFHVDCYSDSIGLRSVMHLGSWLERRVLTEEYGIHVRCNTGRTV